MARALEQGTFADPGSRLVARVHASLAARAVARPLVVPARNAPLIVVTVGGATLGGSGKTRVALACVRELARLGADVVLVGHAYRASPGRPRVVSAADALREVGDEALASARALARTPGARVVVGPDRQGALDYAASLSPRVDAVVIDGPLQLTPVRSSLSLLAVDAAVPWGAGHVAPAGDLRAPRSALLAHADLVVPVDAAPRAVFLEGAYGAYGAGGAGGADGADGARGAGGAREVTLAALASSLAHERVGLFTALARPERLVRALADAGVRPHQVVHSPDHGPSSPRLRRLLVDLPVDRWLATAKCATHLEAVDLRGRLAILDGSVVLPPAVTLALRDLVRAERPFGSSKEPACELPPHCVP